MVSFYRCVRMPSIDWFYNFHAAWAKQRLCLYNKDDPYAYGRFPITDITRRSVSKVRVNNSEHQSWILTYTIADDIKINGNEDDDDDDDDDYETDGWCLKTTDYELIKCWEAWSMISWKTIIVRCASKPFYLLSFFFFWELFIDLPL